MVRINLLPDRKIAKPLVTPFDPTQLWLVAFLAAALVELLVLFVVEKVKRDELATVTAQTQKVQADIDTIKGQVKDHDSIRVRLQELRDREEAINKLQAARSGPTATLVELSRILAPGRGPTTDPEKLAQLRRDNPTAAFNPNWDPQRLWILTYAEQDRVLKISGSARDSEDISEFQKRLMLSEYFYEVKLLPGAKAVDGATKLEVVRFELSAKVRY
jgi:type IV pilus assembly protein PilN